MSATIRENLLVTMAMYAGELLHMDVISIPDGNEGEDVLADFCAECVTNYMNNAACTDIPFCEYAETCLMQRFAAADEPEMKQPEIEYPTHRLIAVSGRCERVLMEGTHDECEFFADDLDWQWSETPGGFVWDLEVEEI